jgi:hypothetical protein
LLESTAQVQVQVRYVLHPWTAKYSHWMWHWAIAFCPAWHREQAWCRGVCSIQSCLGLWRCRRRHRGWRPGECLGGVSSLACQEGGHWAETL